MVMSGLFAVSEAAKTLFIEATTVELLVSQSEDPLCRQNRDNSRNTGF